MNCDEVKTLLPEHAVNALEPRAAEQVRTHLNQPCDACQCELDELTHAATLLAEVLPPSAPPAGVKQRLLDRIDDHAPTPASLPAPNAPLRWGSYLPYAAALLLASLLGAWVASGNRADAPHDLQAAGDRQATLEQWRQRVAEAERAFNAQASRVRQLRMGEQQKLSVAVYPDRVAGQAHLLVTGALPPADGAQLWAWLVPGTGAASGCPLDYLGDGRAAAVIDLNTPIESVERVLITEEAAGEHDSPGIIVRGTAPLGP